MNKNLISLAVLIISSAACIIVGRNANKQFLNKKAVDIAKSCTDDDDILDYEEAKKAIELFKETKKAEDKLLADRFAYWKKANRIEQRRKEFYISEDEELKKFRDDLGYGEALAQINRDKEDSISAFKESIGYDGKIDELKAAISEAESKWKEQEKLFSAADDDISETASKLRHAAEDSKDAAVKRAKEQIADLEAKVKDEETTWDNKIQQTKRSYEEKIYREKRRLNEKTERDIRELDAEVKSAKQDIIHEIQSGRSHEAQKAVDYHSDNLKTVETYEKMIDTLARDISFKTNLSHKIGWWLSENKIPKWLVAVVGFTPVAAIELLLVSYAKFMRDILWSMF